MKRTLFALAILLGATPVSAGPAPKDLIVISGAARFSLSSGHSRLLMLDDASRRVVSDALELDDPGKAALWARVLTGATQLRRENAQSADTLWFNPLFDGGVAIHWQQTDEGWTAVAASAVTGAALRRQTGDIKPNDLTWLKVKGEPGHNLGEAAAVTFQEADSADWSALARAKGNVDAVLMRPYEGNRGLYRLIETPGYEQSLQLVDELLITGDPASLRLPVRLRADLAHYGEDARRSLGPVATYRRPDGWTLVMQSPVAPQIAWLIHFADAKDGKPAVPKGFVVVGTGPVSKGNAQ